MTLKWRECRGVMTPPGLAPLVFLEHQPSHMTVENATMTLGQVPATLPADSAAPIQVQGVEPEVVIAQASVAVRGKPIATGWEGLGSRFVRYFAAVTISAYGDWLTTVALVVLLYRLSGPAAPAGYMVARVLPRLLTGMAGGALADRLRPQRLIASCAVVQGASTAAIIPSARAGMVWAVYGAVVVAQLAGGLARPALGPDSASGLEARTA